jgi:hypothetical protein
MCVKLRRPIDRRGTIYTTKPEKPELNMRPITELIDRLNASEWRVPSIIK